MNRVPIMPIILFKVKKKKNKKKKKKKKNKKKEIKWKIKKKKNIIRNKYICSQIFFFINDKYRDLFLYEYIIIL